MPPGSPATDEAGVSGFSLGTILKAAFIAGLVAGLTAAVFHLIVTEPLIDQAIALEEQHLAAGGAGAAEAAGEHEAPIVSREAQKGGLVLGLLMYALIWSALVGVIYHLAQHWLPGEDGRRKRLLLVLAGYWSVALFPFLKYPANPPGVGDPETIGYRQTLYLAVLVLSLAGTVVAIALARWADGAAARRWLAGLGFLVVFSLALFVLLPASPDPVEMPAEIVEPFRLLSLIGLTLFWAVLGGVFALVLRADSAAQPTAGGAG
jgi:predicted cobalt transporter CbtA